MKINLLLIVSFVIIMSSCFYDNRSNAQINKSFENAAKKQDKPLIDTSGNIIETRIRVPDGFERIDVQQGSFSKYLRNLPLKSHQSKVKYYDGSEKLNYNVYVAVVDLAIGKKDLHQCADAVMRLKAEYLWNEKQYDKIHFNFTNGFRVDYQEWMKGKRIAVKGNKTWWTHSGKASNSYKSFWKYMEIIFSYAGTYSLEKELKKVQLDNLQIGDVFIQGGFPGHAVIVVDVAVNSKSGEKIFMLAQSYMPAQDLQVLVNPGSEEISPWYSVDFGEELETPEWIFKKTDLKRFED